MPKKTVPTSVQLPKAPTWYVLPFPNVKTIEADYRVDTDVDATGVGRVRVKPGYNINVEEIRYDHQ